MRPRHFFTGHTVSNVRACTSNYLQTMPALANSAASTSCVGIALKFALKMAAAAATQTACNTSFYVTEGVEERAKTTAATTTASTAKMK
jgi:hypothetical protein